MFGNSTNQERIEELTRRVASLEQTVATLCRQAGIPQPPPLGVEPSDHVRALAAEGKATHAIKALREETGLGLRAAKEIVDRLPQR